MFAYLKTDQPQGSYIACEQQSPGGAFSRCVIHGAQFIHIEQGPSRDRRSIVSSSLLRRVCSSRRYGIRACCAISLLKLFARTHRADVRNAIHRQNPIQMIDLVLQQFREVPFLSRVNFAHRSAQILIPHDDVPVALHLHENRQETQACIPHHYFFFAAFGDHGIYQWPGLFTWQLQKNNSHVCANLRRRNPASVPSRVPPVRQRIRQVLHQRKNLRRRRISHALRHLAQPRVSQLQDCPYRHIRLSLSALIFLPFPLSPLLLCVLCARCAEMSYGFSHLPDSPARKTASITAMFAIASSSGTGTSIPSRIARENASPCTVY